MILCDNIQVIDNKISAILSVSKDIDLHFKNELKNGVNHIDYYFNVKSITIDKQNFLNSQYNAHVECMLGTKGAVNDRISSSVILELIKNFESKNFEII